jgi:integrase
MASEASTAQPRKVAVSPGIEKRTGPRGTSYYVTVRRKGHPPLYEKFESLKDARAFLARTTANIADGKHNGFSRIKTVKDLIDAFELEATPIKSAVDRTRALNWWVAHYGNVKLQDFDTAMVVQARRKLSTDLVKPHLASKIERPRSGNTVGKYLGALHQALKYGQTVLQWIDRNPAAAVTPPPKSPGRVRWLSDDERKSLLDACKQSANPDLHLIVLLALTSGARAGEMKGLRWSQIDLKQRVVWLEATDTKTARARAVPLVPSVHALLVERSKVRRIDTDLVFVSDVRKSQPRNHRQAFAVALKRAGITDFRFHDLRHSAATEMLRSGVDSRVVGAVLGHRTASMMAQYQHVAPDFIVEAADRSAARLGV